MFTILGDTTLGICRWDFNACPFLIVYYSVFAWSRRRKEEKLRKRKKGELNIDIEEKKRSWGRERREKRILTDAKEMEEREENSEIKGNEMVWWNPSIRKRHMWIGRRGKKLQHVRRHVATEQNKKNQQINKLIN